MEPFDFASPLVVRPARPEDAVRVALMSRDLVEHGLPWRWTAPRVLAQIRRRDTNVVIIRAGARLAGFAIQEYFDQYAHLSLMAVDPAYRRRGVGRRLVRWLEETARVAGLRFVRLEVRARNLEARAFYRALGYGERWSIPGYYSGRETAICLTHDLRSPCPSDFS